jgi:hypothetical protein
MKMLNPWLFGGLALFLVAACDSDSSTSSDDLVDAPDASDVQDDSAEDDAADDDAADDDSADDDSAEDDAADDDSAEDDAADDDAADDDSADAAAADDSAEDDSADDAAEDDSADDAVDAGGATGDESPEAGAPMSEAGPAPAEADDAGGGGMSSMPDSVTIGGSDGGTGIEVTFTGEGVECGMERCRDATVEQFGIGARGCCFDEEESACGLNMQTLGIALGLRDAQSCEQLDAPGSADPACAESDPVPILLPQAPPEGVVMPGCCLPSGECGFSAQFGDWGFGCVGADRFGQESSGSCEYMP